MKKSKSQCCQRSPKEGFTNWELSEKNTMATALKECKTVSATARNLGLSLPTTRNKLRKYGLWPRTT